jgi:hypothetical protein
MKFKLAIISAAAIALPLLLSAAARAGGEPGYFGPRPPLPPVIVHAPSPAEMFFTGIFDIVAAPVGLALNIASALQRIMTQILPHSTTQ